MASAIKIENISKSYGTTNAVDSLSLEVEKGSIFGFLGPNGLLKPEINCSKSMKIILILSKILIFYSCDYN